MAYRSFVRCEHQLMVYVDYVNKLGGSIDTIKKNRETLLVGSKEIGLEVNADKTEYMVMSSDQNAGRSHNIFFSPVISNQSIRYSMS